MATPVKTRFVSVIVMMSIMLKYRDVVENCFSNQYSLELRQRVPSNENWEIVHVIVEVLDPIMSNCILSQTRKGWLISDAVATLTVIYIH